MSTRFRVSRALPKASVAITHVIDWETSPPPGVTTRIGSRVKGAFPLTISYDLDRANCLHPAG